MLPLHKRGHGTEDGIGIAAGEKSEFGSAVIEEIEFNIVRAKLELQIFIGRSEGHMNAPLIDGHDGRKKRMGDSFPSFDIRVVVEEKASDAALFFAVGDVEVAFCGFGKLGVDIRS